MLTSLYYLQWIAVISKNPRLVCEVLLGNGRTVFFVSFLISLLHRKIGWNWSGCKLARAGQKRGGVLGRPKMGLLPSSNFSPITNEAFAHFLSLFWERGNHCVDEQLWPPHNFSTSTPDNDVYLYFTLATDSHDYGLDIIHTTSEIQYFILWPKSYSLPLKLFWF